MLLILENTKTTSCKALMFAFGLSAEIERTLISERTKAGLERAKARGKPVGRQVGQKPRNFKLSPYKEEIKNYMKQGKSINSMAKLYNVRWETMRDFCRVNIYVKPKPPLKSAPKKHGHPSQREIEWFSTH